MSLNGMSVIIPAYNEEKSISEVVRGIRGVFERQEFPFEIIVVNDGSRDRTKEEALSAGATVISRPTNLGYGNALKLGVLRSKYDHVAICDADTTYEPEDFTRLIPFAESFDMVVGAREGREFLGHGWKRIGRWFQLQLVRLTIGRYIPDANSGMRIFQKSILLRYLPGLCGGFSFTTSISLVLHSTERAVKYLPIHYYSRTGTSHVHFVHDTLRSMQLLLQAILKYNPIKAFLFLSSLPAAMALVSLAVMGWALSQAWTTLALAMLILMFLSLSCVIIVFALGMLAYAVQSNAEKEFDPVELEQRVGQGEVHE